MRCLHKAFANRIKMESSDQDTFQETIKGSGQNPNNKNQWINDHSAILNY